MKSILTSLLSIFITLILIVLGISISVKNVITETVTIIIKEEITNKIVETSNEETTKLTNEEIKEKVDEILKKNKEINNFVNSSFDKLMKVLNDEIKINEINFESEVNDLLETITPLLNEYGITITDEMKNEIMSYVKTEEANNFINKTITEIKESLPENMNVMITTFTNLVSMKYKIFLISLIIVFLTIIALIKKSYYSWTINLSIPSIITGIFYTSFTYLINDLIETEEITINMNSLKNYGILNIILGIVLLIIYIVLNKKLKNKQVEEIVE